MNDLKLTILLSLCILPLFQGSEGFRTAKKGTNIAAQATGISAATVSESIVLACRASYGHPNHKKSSITPKYVYDLFLEMFISNI